MRWRVACEQPWQGPSWTAQRLHHCLLHALMRGGIINVGRIPESLTVFALRAMALNIATPQQIQVAAASTGSLGVSVATYKRGLLRNMRRDMISCLAREFDQDITVISSSYTRTCLAAGGRRHSGRCGVDCPPRGVALYGRAARRQAMV